MQEILSNTEHLKKQLATQGVPVDTYVKALIEDDEGFKKTYMDKLAWCGHPWLIPPEKAANKSPTEEAFEFVKKKLLTNVSKYRYRESVGMVCIREENNPKLFKNNIHAFLNSAEWNNFVAKVEKAIASLEKGPKENYFLSDNIEDIGIPISGIEDMGDFFVDAYKMGTVRLEKDHPKLLTFGFRDNTGCPYKPIEFSYYVKVSNYV